LLDELRGSKAFASGWFSAFAPELPDSVSVHCMIKEEFGSGP
jgi:hypothetical protein